MGFLKFCKCLEKTRFATLSVILPEMQIPDIICVLLQDVTTSVLFRITCIFYVKEMANHLIKTCCLCSLTMFIQQSNEGWYLSGLANNTLPIFLNREIPKQVPLKKGITHFNLSLEEIISAKVFVRYLQLLAVSVLI